MKKNIFILLLAIGFVGVFYPYKVLGFNEVYLKTAGIVLTMFSVYKLSSKVTSKNDNEDTGNFKF